jgi:hypothetical protein
MAIADRTGLPLAIHVAAASPHEVTLVEATLAERFVAARPARLIGDTPLRDLERAVARVRALFG